MADEIVKAVQTILPPGAKGCGSIRKAMEMMLESYPIEFGENHEYVEICLRLGLDPASTTLAVMHAHVVNVNALNGDMTAEKILQEGTEGKVKERLPEDDPIKNLTDKQLDELEAEQKILLENKDAETPSD